MSDTSFKFVCAVCGAESVPMTGPRITNGFQIMGAANLVGWKYANTGSSIILVDTEECYEKLWTKKGTIRKRRPPAKSKTKTE
jgi:hypothetical protein